MNKKIKVFISVLAILLVFGKNTALALTIDDENIEKLKYSDEYDEWLQLPEDDKNKCIEPQKFDIQNVGTTMILDTIKNPIFYNNIVKSSVNKRFSLKDIIGNNTKVKNQGETNGCWAFSALGALETTLALQDYNNNSDIMSYDFSEKHMMYSCFRNCFLDNQINEKGINSDIAIGGNFYYAQNYLSSGRGPINEQDLPFEGVNKYIPISDILNKDVVTTVYDTKNFVSDDSEQIKTEMKEFISTYGGVSANIYGAQLSSEEFYNNETGGLYVNDPSIKTDHAVLIIGWDDEYSKNNFKSTPQNDGAWIARNSWGEKLKINIDKFKQEYFEMYKNELNNMGIYNYNEISDQAIIRVLEETGYTYDGDRICTKKIGDNGYIYISYEDLLVYSNVNGIKKAKYGKNYNKVYENDELGVSTGIVLNGISGKKYIANEFNRNKEEKESIDKVGVFTFENWNNCKVFVNPNGSDKDVNSLKEIELKEGNASTNTINLESGYHIIEFANPIELTADKFVVVLEIDNDNIIIPIESNSEPGWEYAEINDNESYVTFEDTIVNNDWVDLYESTNPNLIGNITLKAYTENLENNQSGLENIVITKQPDKTIYKVGESFDKTGMQVMATYKDGNKKVVTNYSVIDGNNLEEGKTTVTISYTENNVTRTVSQPISVTKNGNESIDKNPKSSDFSNAIAIIKEQNETEISLEITNIKIGDLDNIYKYAYAIMPSRSITDVRDEYYNIISEQDVVRQNDGTCKITINTNINRLNNAADLLKAENLYLHIREVAKFNDKEIVSNAVLNLEIKDKNVLQNNTNNNKDTDIQVIDKIQEDVTTANKILPHTGKINLIIAILIIFGMAVFLYYKYKNIDR